MPLPGLSAPCSNRNRSCETSAIRRTLTLVKLPIQNVKNGHFTLKSMASLIDSANFAVGVYLIFGRHHQVCLGQESGSLHFSSCPGLNRGGQGHAEEFPQRDLESGYIFGSGPNCFNPMTWRVFLLLLCSLHLVYCSDSHQVISKGRHQVGTC